MKRYAFFALLSAVAVAPAAAQDTTWNRYTLEGLGGVFLRAEASEACEAAGATPSSVEADAAVLLLESDVPLLTEEEMLANVALPELRITLECSVGDGNGLSDAVAYSVSLRVQQAVKMIRDEQVTHPEAVTWYATHVGVATASDAATAVGTALDAKLREFATAYTEANAEGEGGAR